MYTGNNNKQDMLGFCFSLLNLGRTAQIVLVSACSHVRKGMEREGGGGGWLDLPSKYAYLYFKIEVRAEKIK